MSTTFARRRQPTTWLLRSAVAIGCALVLSGCVVYPAGYYGRPPGYYYGYPHAYYYR
jgi:hypothetical protein